MQSLQNGSTVPVSITIRDVPDDVHAELVARAARSGRSLQAYLRAELIKLAERPDPEDLMARVREKPQDNRALMAAVRERVRREGARVSAEDILRWRDEGRR